VLGDAVNKEILAFNNDIDTYIVFKKNISEMMQILRKEKFDAAILMGPSPETLALLYLSGIPLIASPVLVGGFSPMNTISYKLLLKLVSRRPHKLGNYAPREYLRLLEVIDIVSENTKKYLIYSKDGDEKVLDFYKKKGVNLGKDLVVGIFPSTGNKIKLWSSDKFAKVADCLWERYNAKIVLIGSDADSKEVGEVLNLKKNSTEIINAFKLFNMDELKAAISKMSIMISVDTGPIYIAEAFGVATVDIVGPVDEKDQPPVGDIHRVVAAPRKKPEMGVFNARVYDKIEARRQSEMVIRAIESLILALDKREKSL
jgi:ADP-heptose:LPS heptosyltransferase